MKDITALFLEDLDLLNSLSISVGMIIKPERLYMYFLHLLSILERQWLTIESCQVYCDQVFYRSIRFIWNNGGTKFFITCFHPCHHFVFTFAARCISWCLSADTGPQPGSSGMLSRHHTKSGMNIYGSLNGVLLITSSINCPWLWLMFLTYVSLKSHVSCLEMSNA